MTCLRCSRQIPEGKTVHVLCELRDTIDRLNHENFELICQIQQLKAQESKVAKTCNYLSQSEYLHRTAIKDISDLLGELK